MKIKAIKFKRNEIIKIGQEREAKTLILLSALFACGMIIGAGFYRVQNNTVTDILKNILYQAINYDIGIIQSFAHEIIFNCALLSLLIFSGVSCVGIPLIIPVVFFKGLSIGLFSGYLISVYAVKGMCYYLITILPADLFINAGLLITAANSCIFSSDILFIVSGKIQPEKSSIKEYVIKIFSLLVFTVILSFISASMQQIFSSILNG